MATPGTQRNVTDLTNWFLNAKNSLNSVTYCTRGNEIITSTRNALIDASIMASRASFLQNGIKDELKLLQHANTLMENQRETARKGFQTSLGDLDEANHRLDEILSLLRATEVEEAFSTAEKSEQQVQRSLFDFVDEDGIENLRSRLRGIIDQVQETDENFESHLEPFTQLIAFITESLGALSKKSAPAIPNPVVAITPSLQSMEDHASVMASLLESLARHYDLCSMALKRAESHDSGVSSQEGDLQTEEDKADMLAVLQRDAGEVDDVVTEIKERLDEMETTSVLVEQTVAHIGDHYRTMLSLLSKMHEGQSSLVNCTIQSKEFVQKQMDNQGVIAERLDELQRLTDHYVLFGEAYDALLVEVGRRIAVQRQKDSIIQEALAKIDMLNEGDLNEREQFRSEFGDYLPSDIWPGLSDPPGAPTFFPPLETRLALKGEKRRRNIGTACFLQREAASGSPVGNGSQMSFHSYGRSLRLAVSRRPQKQHSYHIRTISSGGTQNSAPAPENNNNNDDNTSTRPVRHQYDLRRERHPYQVRLEEDSQNSNLNISDEDRQFVWTAKSGNLKSDLRKRVYFEHSILRPNSYDILANFSRKHARGKVTKEHTDISPPPPPIPRRLDQQLLQREPEAPIVKADGERDSQKVSNHRQLFTSIDNGLIKGGEDWPATFYLVACAEAYGKLDNRVRTASISYLVKKFVLGGRHNDILRLHTEIQNSWLPLDQRELDTLEYFKALFEGYTEKPAPNHTVVTQILEAFQTASQKFDRQFTLRQTRGFKEEIVPHLLLFLSCNAPLHNSLNAIKSQASKIASYQTGTILIPLLFNHLNKALITSQNIKTSEQNGQKLGAFYATQSNILQTISKIPRTPSVGIELAKVLLQQAVTWEEVLEAKRLILHSGEPSGIIDLQTQIFRSLHRLSTDIQPGSIRARNVAETMNDLFHLINFRGAAGDRRIVVGIGAAIYARFGYFTALEQLLNGAERLGVDFSLPAIYTREMMRNLNVSLRGKLRKGAKPRAAGIAVGVLGLYTRGINKAGGERIHQGLLQDLLQLLVYCGDTEAMHSVWEIVIAEMPLEKLKLSTLSAFVEGFLKTGDIKFAREIISAVDMNKNTKITASLIRPFLTAESPDAKLVLDDIVRLGMEHDISWGSVAHVHSLHQAEEVEAWPLANESVVSWAEAIQDCADEVVWARQGRIMEKTVEKVEKEFAM
ncbi:hypothetical protein H072_7927 [Dactylellina haptotyla CBS 200.50]|uniref:Autophagy-related protein 17 n=1 Tax=Dactylellina haptotyla (strain CBS 200.50) TaxID=1284197 RepID=S8BG25_DACHA|nr:hypothetical protein H072_7927 [Dactylellina haptotyla CBS 200.50]